MLKYKLLKRYVKVKNYLLTHETGFKFVDFIKWVIVDKVRAYKNRHNKVFDDYGLTLFCNRQGSGKTTGMVEYLERMRKKFPDIIIMTNFGYKYETRPLEGWRDLINVRNGDKGVIFAVDEIHSEFSSTRWADFPEDLLRQVSMQRKQKVKIIGSSQIYTRVVKQLREQTFSVIESTCILGRWVVQRAFDAQDYNQFIDTSDDKKKDKVKRLFVRSFISTDYLRGLFDTYKVIEKMSGDSFIPTQNRLK